VRWCTVWLVAALCGCKEPSAVKQSECATQVGRSLKSNAAALYAGASTCFGEQRDLDGTFLLVGAQIRAMADMNLLRPLGDADERKVGELYSFLFFRGGGAGSTRVYRDPASSKALFESLEAWQPELPAGYDPGWQYKPSSRLDLYERILRHHCLAWEDRGLLDPAGTAGCATGSSSCAETMGLICCSPFGCR